jgi:hypothetical protein
VTPPSVIEPYCGKFFDAVFISRAFIWSGVRVGCAYSKSATAPLTTPAAMLAIQAIVVLGIRRAAGALMKVNANGDTTSDAERIIR